MIDEEVATLLREAEQRATVTLTNHHHTLDRLTELLRRGGHPRSYPGQLRRAGQGNGKHLIPLSTRQSSRDGEDWR